MGGMDFFKKIFSREPEKVSVNHIELKDWLEEVSEKSLSEENKKVKETLANAKDSKIKLKEKLELLEKAELMNKSIPDREIHIMQGNRTNYVNKMYGFLEKIKLPQNDFESIENFNKEFQEELNKLNEETAKGYFVLKNFFDRDMADIAASIKEVENEVKELKQILNSEKMSSYRKLLAKTRELNELCIKKDTLKEELKRTAEEIKETEEKKNNFEAKLKNLKEGQEWQVHFRMETEKNEMENNIKELNSRLNNIIKPLDKPIKKVSHDTGNELLQKYLNEPLQALTDDTELKFFESIPAIRQEAELTEKKDKYLGYLDELKKETFEQIRKEYYDLLNHKKMVEEILSRSTMVMDMKELDYQIEHVTEKHKRLTQAYEEKKDALDKLKIEDKAKKLENELSEFTEKIISIEF